MEKTFPRVVLLLGDSRAHSCLGLCTRFRTRIGHPSCGPRLIESQATLVKLTELAPEFLILRGNLSKDPFPTHDPDLQMI